MATLNMCWSWEVVVGLSISRLWEEMRHQWSTRNAYRRIRGEIETEDRFHQDLGRICCQGIPFGLAAPFCNSVLGKGPCLSGRCEDDLASMRSEAAESIWGRQVADGKPPRMIARKALSLF